jgi:hypothetical protein
MKLRIYKKDRLFASKTWVSNGHWLLPRSEFKNKIFELEAYYQGLVDSGVDFEKRWSGIDSISIGKDADLPEFEKVLNNCAKYPVELTDLIQANKYAVISVPEIKKATVVAKGYAHILKIGGWFCDKKLHIFQRIENKQVTGMVMGIRQSEQDTAYLSHLLEMLRD